MRTAATPVHRVHLKRVMKILVHEILRAETAGNAKEDDRCRTLAQPRPVCDSRKETRDQQHVPKGDGQDPLQVAPRQIDREAGKEQDKGHAELGEGIDHLTREHSVGIHVQEEISK